jgi:hypothetical protein
MNMEAMLNMAAGAQTFSSTLDLIPLIPFSAGHRADGEQWNTFKQILPRRIVSDLWSAGVMKDSEEAEVISAFVLFVMVLHEHGADNATTASIKRFKQAVHTRQGRLKGVPQNGFVLDVSKHTKSRYSPLSMLFILATVLAHAQLNDWYAQRHDDYFL